jgi:cysteine-rich repeat protein
MRALPVGLVLGLGLLSGCAGDGEPGPTEPVDPGHLGDLVGDALAGVTTGTVASSEIEFNLFDLDEVELDGEVTRERCDAVDATLQVVCEESVASGEASYCSYQTAFFYAHDIPRCAVRFHAYTGSNDAMAPVYALDFAGTPLSEPAPSCGNGIVDEAAGEACDDGNLEMWDGCDPTCQPEPFEGCETVIESYYQAAGLATVDADTWTGPRSHLMVNHGAALKEMDAAACSAAVATAVDVCAELQLQMPFVSWCSAAGAQHVDAAGPACSIRLTVYFDQLAPDTGVFTTSLPGILAFTIR